MINYLVKHPLFSNSVRVFFPLAALMAVLIPMYTVTTIVNGYPFSNPHFSLYEWHGFEMLFGFFYTLIIGFILTAGAHWTGQRPISGLPLIALTFFWVLDQVCLFLAPSIWAPIMSSSILGIYFLYIIFNLLKSYAKKWIFFYIFTGLTILKIVYIYGAAHRGFHYKNTIYDLVIYFLSLLTIIIGGRVIPNFTKNFFNLSHPLNAPDWLNKSSLILASSLICTSFPISPILSSILFILTGLSCLIRMIYWKPVQALKKPIIGMLHIGYFTLSTSLIVKGLTLYFDNLSYTRADLHLILSGGVSIMALNIMIRATLGHTGRKIILNKTIALMYITILIGMIIRFIVPVFFPDYFIPSLHHSMGFWTLAFLIYLIRFTPMVFKPRVN